MSVCRVPSRGYKKAGSCMIQYCMPKREREDLKRTYSEIIGKLGHKAIHVDVSSLLGIQAHVLLHRVPSIFFILVLNCLELS